MKKLLLILSLLLSFSSTFAQGYTNPVLPGFHADPSVIGSFTGVMLGVFAQGTDKKGYADFDWFEYITQ